MGQYFFRRQNEDRSFALDAKIHNNREVIGGNQCLASAMDHDLQHIHSPIKIDVVEVHQWKKARIRPGPSEERTDGNAGEMIFEQTRSES